MEQLNRVLLDNLSAVVLALAVVVFALLLYVVVLSLRVRRATRRYADLVRDTQGGSLQDVLHAHIERVSGVSRDLADLRQLYQALAERTQGTLQHVGMVRFNPFEDTGSDQSFVIALLDDRRDGIVLSGLHGREGTRVFAKPVEAGASRHSLSPEEGQAIQIAVEGTQVLGGPR